MAVPWALLASHITSVEVEPGVTGDMNLAGLFCGLTAVTKMDLHNLYTGSTGELSYMFKDCSSLIELDPSALDLTCCMRAQGMFENCSSLERVNLETMETTLVVLMNNLFKGCPSLKELDLRSFDTGFVQNHSGMFAGCDSLETVLVGPEWTLGDWREMLAE